MRMSPTTTLFIALWAVSCHSSSALISRKANPALPQSRTTALSAIPPELVETVEGSRAQFYGWFFGASGGGGVALSAFPKMFQQFQAVQSLKSPSSGDNNIETIGISPLCGYPEDISVQDASKIVNNPLTIEQIVAKYPIQNNFLSKNGYLTFDAFQQANTSSKNDNNLPLAVRAIFDTFAQSQNACDPTVAQAKIDSYQQDLSQIKGNLLQAKLTGYSAIGTLLFLLGLAATIVCGHLKDGWFPEWTWAYGILAIPDYWI